jgi:iron complex transport system substrate-binding protein
MEIRNRTRVELISITSGIIGVAITIHQAFGPGLLESVYATCLARDLTDAGFDVETDYPIALTYKDVHIECAFRADIVVDRCVLVELKPLEQIAPVHLRQVTTYLRLADYRVALPLNFGVAVLKDGGIHRRVNQFPD